MEFIFAPILVSAIKALSLIVCFAFVGMTLKFVDQAFDERIFSRTIAVSLSILAGVFMGILISVDYAAAILLISIIIGVGLTAKLDNFGHQLAAVIAFMIPFIFYMYPVLGVAVDIRLIPIFIFSLSGVSDEVLDAIGDKKKIWVLTTRPVMKIMALVFALVGVYNISYFFAFISFDIAYIMMKYYSVGFVIESSSLGKWNNPEKSMSARLMYNLINDI